MDRTKGVNYTDLFVYQIIYMLLRINADVMMKRKGGLYKRKILSS